ncbi:MAG: Amt family ammonium transporter [Granulosicoccus sp.]|jgi:Amt family ammonium transporter
MWWHCCWCVRIWGIGGLGGVSQIIGALTGIVVATLGEFVVYGVPSATVGIKLTEEEEFNGADPRVLKIFLTSR